MIEWGGGEGLDWRRVADLPPLLLHTDSTFLQLHSWLFSYDKT
jgi:hypothetical protein